MGWLACRGVLFDLDGTLVDRIAALRRLIALLYDANPALHKELPVERFVTEVLEADRDGYAPQPYYAFIVQKWPVVGTTVAELAKWHESRFPDCFEPDPRVIRLFDQLDRAGYPVGIVTNGGPIQRRKIERSHIAIPPDRVFVSSEIGIAKPNPEVFMRAVRSLGLAPKGALFVGDHPETDVEGARRCGMAVAWISRDRVWPTGLEAPDVVLSHVSSLAAVLGLPG